MDSNNAEKKNNTYCSVPQCKSKGSMTTNISFHKFPAMKSVVWKTTSDGCRISINRRKEWARILKIRKEISNRMTVCSKHFDRDSYTFPPEKCQRARLKSSALPSLFLPTISYSEKKVTLIKEEHSAKRLDCCSEINGKKRISNASSKIPSTSTHITGAPIKSLVSEAQTADPKKINNTYCCVLQCKSKGSTTPNVSFHKFPATKSVLRKTTSDGQRILVNRRKEWARILKIRKEVSNRMTICSKHFDKDSYTFPPEKCQRLRLKSSAVPTLFLPITSSNSEKKVTIKEEDSA